MNENKFTNGMPDNSDSGHYYKIKEGVNKLRILTPGAIIAEHFKIGVCVGKEKGCKGCDVGDKATYKKMFWVIDRNDGEIKLAKFGSKILQQLGGLSEDSDYAFSSFPMPYDVKINAKGAGTKEVEYSVTPSPKHEPLTETEQEKFAKERDPEEIIKMMKNKMLGIKNETTLSKTVGNFGEKPDYHYPTPEEEGINVDDEGWVEQS